MSRIRTPLRRGQSPAEPPPGLSYHALRLPSGELLPIEVRLGRRLLRTIDPRSEEGRRLLRQGRVDLSPLAGEEESAR